MLSYYLIALLIVAVDQLTKFFTVQNIELHEIIPVIPGVLSFTYIQNDGAAWSILEGEMMFFYIVTVVVVIAIIYFLHKYGRESNLFGVSLAFVLGGAIGNFIDRLLYQYVIDMIRLEFINFPIFNVADSALTIGVILMIVYILFFDEEKTQKEIKKDE